MGVKNDKQGRKTTLCNERPEEEEKIQFCH
jgi:hypothetical protein